MEDAPEDETSAPDEHFRPAPVVIAACDGSRIEQTRVEFLDIHEDIAKRDVLTYTCPLCGGIHESLILG